MQDDKYFIHLQVVFNQPARELETPINIGCRCGECNRCGNPAWKCRAIWDTGATNSMISKEIAHELELKPIGQTSIVGVHGAQSTNLYRVDLLFDCGYVIPAVEVSEAADHCGFELLIGMDIISDGNFILRNDCGKTVSNSNIQYFPKFYDSLAVL